MIDFEEAFDSVALSFIKICLFVFFRFNLLVVLYGGYHVCIVTLSPVYQLMDNILNGSMFKNVHDRVIP